MHNGYVRHPDAFNPTAYAQANDRAHTSAPGHFQITATTHPALFEVFEAISADNSGGAGHATYSVPDVLAARAKLAEAFLSLMSPEERQAAATGEESEAEEAMAAHAESVEEWSDVSAFLNLFFEDWHGVE